MSGKPVSRQELECHFSCNACGIGDATFWVPARTVGMEVNEWMERVFLPVLGSAHHQLSPNCQARTITEVKIPVASKGVGFIPTEDDLKAVNS